jgi:hypothetical protein
MFFEERVAARLVEPSLTVKGLQRKQQKVKESNNFTAYEPHLRHGPYMSNVWHAEPKSCWGPMP